MTPKFDNLASLLMEVKYPRKKIEDFIQQHPDATYSEIGKKFNLDAKRVADIATAAGIARGRGANIRALRKRLNPRDQKIADYIRKHQNVRIEDIARKFELSQPHISRIMKDAGITDRPHLMAQLAGTEAHPSRKLTNDQEKAIINHYIENQDTKSMSQTMEWANAFVIGNPELGGTPDQTPLPLGKRSARSVIVKASERQNIPMPPTRYGPPKQLQVKSQHRNEPGTGKLPTQGSQQFSGSDQIVPSNPKHGGPAHPPK